jgi:uncharacterized protein
MQASKSRYVRHTDMLSLPLENGWLVNFNPLGPVGITVLNPSAQQLLALFDGPVAPQLAVKQAVGMSAHVAASAINSLAQVGLLRPVDGALGLSDRPSTLSAWLHVTEACNLNCPYCYVHKRPRTMSVEVGRTAADRLVDMAVLHGYTTLKLKYAGGEPTLAFPVMRAIHARAAQRAAQAGVILEEVVLSNGVGVTDGVLDSLVAAGMKLMVSLDGGAETHDLVRTRRDGRSSYAAVVDTVERAVARGLRPNISITLTALNLDGVEDAVAFALKRNLPFNLNFYRECSPSESRGPQDDGSAPSPLVPEPTRLVAAMLRIFGLIRTYPTYPLPLSGILDRTRLDIPHSYSCSAGRNYLAVDATGRVSACQMLLEDPHSDLSDQDPLNTIRQYGQELFLPVEALSECAACVWRTACSGGCPLMRQSALHDSYCQVYRTLFPELVRLEGNRLLACHA